MAAHRDIIAANDEAAAAAAADIIAATDDAAAAAAADAAADGADDVADAADGAAAADAADGADDVADAADGAAAADAADGADDAADMPPQPLEWRQPQHQWPQLKHEWCVWYWRSRGCHHGDTCMRAHSYEEYCGPRSDPWLQVLAYWDTKQEEAQRHKLEAIIAEADRADAAATTGEARVSSWGTS